jgi:methyltransferase (TIGR00027 family)
MPAGAASRTAVFVCQGRAVADGRLAPDRFSDPVAASMLRADEREEVERARSDRPPTSGRERVTWERLRACGEGMTPRTVLIDDAVSRAGNAQLVIVGAGLDTRPWRRHDLADVEVFSVDHPSSQADCRRRSLGLDPVAARLVFVPVDLSEERLGPALDDAGHDPTAPTTWLWEGVVPYLTPDDIDVTLRSLGDRSAEGSTLVLQYQERSAIAVVGRRVSSFVARRGGLDDPMADEPWRSLWSPKAMGDLLARHGFVVNRDEDLLNIAIRIGSPTTHRRSLANGRVAIATATARTAQT